MRSRLQRWIVYLPLALLVLTILALFYRLLLGEVIFWGLPSLQFYPWREFALSELAAGRLPLWNPYNGAGAPLLANYQIALLYPPNWLYLALPGPQTMGWLGMAHLLLAGVGMWRLTGRFKCESLGRGIATLAYPLSSTIVARFGTIPMLDAATWLPWLILAVDGLLEDVTAIRLVALAVVSAMLLLAGHAQWTFYCMALAGAYAFWQLIAGRKTPVTAIKIALAGIVALALGGSLSAAQLLPTAEYMAQSQRASGVDQTFALNFSYAPLSLVTLFNPNFFGNPGDGSYAIKGEYFETTAYVGILPVALAILVTLQDLRRRRRRKTPLSPVPSATNTGEKGASLFREYLASPSLIGRESDQNGAPDSPSPSTERGSGGEVIPPPSLIPFFGLTALISLVLAFGQYTPFGGLLYRLVPTFNLFQAPARWLLLTVFSLAMLAAQAATFWQPTANHRAQRNVAVALIGSVILIVAGLGAQVVLASAKPIVRELAQGMTTTGFLTLIVSVFFATQPTDPLKRQRWQIAVLIFVALDLLWANSLSNPTVPASFYQTGSPTSAGRLFWPDPADQQLPQSAFDTYLRPDDYRVAVERWQDYRHTDLPDMNILDRQPLFNNFDPLRPDGFERYTHLLNVNPNAPNLLRAAAIGQVVGTSTLAATPDRVWIVPQAISAANADEAQKLISAADWNPMQTVVIELGQNGPLPPALSPSARSPDGIGMGQAEGKGTTPLRGYLASASLIARKSDQNGAPGSPSPSTERGSAGEVNSSPGATIVSETPLSLDIDVTAPPGGGYLVLADAFYPGWQATLDGQPTAIYRANLAFRAVAAPEGEHHISMTYDPRSWRLGVLVSVASLALAILLLVGGIAMNAYRRRKGEPVSLRLRE